MGDLLNGVQFQVHADDEDIHTANERRLSELVGAIGGKLHTGRSRNDQVATDVRLWLLDEAGKIGNNLKELIHVIAERADQEKTILMPGYTHLQVLSEIWPVERYRSLTGYHVLASTAHQMVATLIILRVFLPRRP